jgi:hypothetical protein
MKVDIELIPARGHVEPTDIPDLPEIGDRCQKRTIEPVQASRVSIAQQVERQNRQSYHVRDPAHLEIEYCSGLEGHEFLRKERCESNGMKSRCSLCPVFIGLCSIPYISRHVHILQAPNVHILDTSLEAGMTCSLPQRHGNNSCRESL